MFKKDYKITKKEAIYKTQKTKIEKLLQFINFINHKQYLI